MSESKYWWEKFPTRLRQEEKCLAELGIRWELDQERFEQGTLVWTLYPVVDGTEVELIAIFPDHYPYFPFEVRAPGLRLPYHQNPRAKNLCLLPQGGRWWNPASDLLGEVVEKRLPTVIQAALSHDPAEFADLEVHQAEPYSKYYEYAPESMVLVDGPVAFPGDARSGFLKARVTDLRPQENVGVRVRAEVLEFVGRGHRTIQESELFKRQQTPGQEVRGCWLRVDTPPDASKPAQELMRELRNDLLAVSHSKKRVTVRNGEVLFLSLVAVEYPLEVDWRGTAQKPGQAWLFLIRIQTKKGEEKLPWSYIREGCMGDDELSQRIPQLRPLRAKRVALFGLGGVGAPSALEFARSGIGELRIWDYDHLAPGNIVRWPLGIPACGPFKSTSLLEFIRAHYPHVKVSRINWRLGTARRTNERVPLEQEVVGKFLTGVDLIFDAMADRNIQQFLSVKAAEAGIPYVSAEGTPGLWGGLILCLRPGLDRPCWCCVRSSLGAKIPSPPEDVHEGELQARGCGDLTFTGTSFDLLQLSSTAVRFAIKDLVTPESSEGRTDNWEVAVLRLRDRFGGWLLPTWRSYRVDRNPSCPSCGEDQ